MNPAFLLLLITLWAAACTVGQSADVPLGHKDFYPSDERPVGYRGDGRGWFPGATIVSEWWDGTPTQKDLPAEVLKGAKKARTTKYWDLDEAAPKNIVWKTQMPSWANTQPLVVGDRVFTLNEFWSLSCVDANSGKILWTHSCSPWDAAGLDRALVQRLENLYDIQQAAMGFPYRMFAFGTVTRGIPIEEVSSLLGDYEKDVPRILEGLKQYDPDNMAVYEAEGKKALQAMEPLRHPDTLPLKNHQGYPRAIDFKSMAEANKNLEKDIRSLDQTILKRIRELGKIKACLQQPWGNMVGFCMQAPASDGRRVYARWYQGQTVCVDLEGKRLWAKFDEGFSNAINGACGNPPVLFDRLVYLHYPGPKHAFGKAYDKLTGEEKWTVNLDRSGSVRPPVPMRLKNTTPALAVLVLQDGQIIRMKDGVCVGKLPRDDGPECSPAVAVGNLLFGGGTKQGQTTLAVSAYRLTERDENAVEAVKVYTTQIPPKHQGIIASDKYLVDTDVVAISTGTILNQGKQRKNGDRTSDILCGNLRIWCGGEGGGMLAWGPTLDHGWGGRRFDGKSLRFFTVEDLTNPANPRTLSTTNYLGGAFQPPVPWYQKWSPALYANPNYFDKSTGKPAHVIYQDTGVYAQGNRLFIRTVGHLYCIGDPKVPYDWNAASRPEETTKGLGK